MPNAFSDSFFSRYRRSLGIGGWLACVLLTIVFYYATEPRPAGAAGGGNAQTADVPTIQVGALPVT